MKKLITMLMIIGMISFSNAQQLRFGESQYFTTSIAIDPSATIKEKSPNIVAEIECVSHFMYVKGSIQVLPDLEGGYFEYGGGAGLNLTSGYFDEVRYYTGIRLGVIRRGGNPYPLAGFEGGIDYNVTDSMFIGLRGTGDWREDFMFSGAEPEMRYSGFVRLGLKF